MRAASAHQHRTHTEVDQRSHHRKQQTNAKLLHRLRGDQALHGRVDNGHRRHQNQTAFHLGGEVLRLGVAEIVVLIRRLGGQLQCPEANHGGGDVGQRFQRVRKETN